MEVLAATAIRYDSTGKQSAFKIGRIETATNTWVMQPAPLPAAELIELLQGGERVLMVLGRTNPSAPTPLLMVDAGGDKVVVEGTPVKGRLVGDLPRF